MQVRVHYGDGWIELSIPERNLIEVVRPWDSEGRADNKGVVVKALESRASEEFLRQAKGRRICVLVADGTRDMPIDDVFGEVFGLLKGCSKVRFLVCTGTHNADTAANRIIVEKIERFSSKAGLRDVEAAVHSCEGAEFLSAGRTSRGTEIIYNRFCVEAELFLVLSDVKCHYFAGYSNPVKNFVPGMCDYSTAEHNHSFTLDDSSTYGRHPWHSDKKRRGNAVAEDQVEGMKLIAGDRDIFSFLTISSSGRIDWAGFGQARQICAKAFDIVDKKNCRRVEIADRLIVSPGGGANEVNLYIAQRALELTKSAVCDGGEILFLSACPGGVGEQRTMENFYQRLTEPIENIYRSIEGEYKLFSHKAYRFAQLAERMRRVWMYSQISDEVIESIHLFAAKDPQKVIDGWIAEEKNVRILVVDGGNKIGLYGVGCV